MLILNRQDVEQLLDPQQLLQELSAGFQALSAGTLNVPPRNQAIAPKGVLVGMPAYMPEALMAVKLVSVFHENHLRNIPDHQAVIVLFDSETGSPAAMMDGEYITALRTAAGAILSIQSLARKDSTNIAIIGAGVLGAAHLQMLRNYADFKTILIASQNQQSAQTLAETDVRAKAVETSREAVLNADVICLCTSSLEPVLQADWIKSGTHISSVGYRPPGGELPRDLVHSSHLFVETMAAFDPPPVGSAELQGMDAAAGTELGLVLSGERPGRKSAEEITIYKSMGHAMEDLVAANLVYKKAFTEHIGQTILM